MTDLLEQKCVPCGGSLPPATEAEIKTYKTQIPNWDIITDDNGLRLRRVYQLANFNQALAFTNQIGEIAEQEGHHPALLTEWGKVTITWWTHAINSLHQNDFIMAAKCDSIYSSYR